MTIFWHTILPHIANGVHLMVIYLCMHYADINECKDLQKYPCYGNCKNKEGSYDCTCRPGYHSRDPTTEECALNFSLAKQLAIGIYTLFFPFLLDEGRFHKWQSNTNVMCMCLIGIRKLFSVHARTSFLWNIFCELIIFMLSKRFLLR